MWSGPWRNVLQRPSPSAPNLDLSTNREESDSFYIIIHFFINDACHCDKTVIIYYICCISVLSLIQQMTRVISHLSLMHSLPHFFKFLIYMF